MTNRSLKTVNSASVLEGHFLHFGSVVLVGSSDVDDRFVVVDCSIEVDFWLVVDSCVVDRSFVVVESSLVVGSSVVNTVE